MGAAHRRHRPGVGPAVAVEHGQGPEIAGPAAQPEHQRIAHGVQEGAAMVVDHALGVAGGARGVAERDGVPLVGRRLPGEGWIAPGQQGLIVQIAQPLAGCSRIDDVDHGGTALHLRQRLLDDRRPFGVGQQHLGLAMLEDEGDRGRVEPRVERVEHGPGHRDAVMRLQHRRDVRAQDRHGVAAPDTQPSQGACQPAAAPVDLAPTERQFAVDDASPLGEDRGAPGQEVERGQRPVVGARPRQPGIENAGPALAHARAPAAAARKEPTGWRAGGRGA